MAFAIDDIVFSGNVIEVISSQIKKFGWRETGGVLLGYLDNGVLNVEKASAPGPKATHEPEYFRADANYIDMFIDMEIANSGGRLRYLGEWHTHPQIEPYPSKIDFISLSEIAASCDDFVVMLIVGAVQYVPEKFSKQHIALVKFKEDIHFYKY